MAQSPCFYLPLIVPLFFLFAPFLLTWNPPSCDRNRPPRSQVACKLTPPFHHLAHVPSHPKSRPPLGFPDSDMHLIRATLRTQPISSRTLPLCKVANLLFTLLQFSALDAPRSSTISFSGCHVDQGSRLVFPASSVGPPRVFPPEVLHAEAFRPFLVRFPCGLGLHHLSDSLHGRIHPAERGDRQLEQGAPQRRQHP